MIRVNKNFDDVPAGLTSPSAEEKRLALMNEKNSHNFSSDCYGHETVRKALEERIYHYKCAYCEGHIADGFTLHIEHYRPKNKLKEDAQHSGYYWLAYEWSNLLLACQDCNSPKSNRFPITGVRVHHPQDKQHWRVDSPSFLIEQALLLNSEIDNPELHFDFQPNGELIFKTVQGETTIKLCNLNRESLRIARKRVLDDAANRLLDQILIFFEQKLDGKLATQERYSDAMELGFKNAILALKQATQPECKYSAFTAFLFNHFDTFICEPIAAKFSKEFSDVLFQAYEKFAEV